MWFLLQIIAEQIQNAKTKALKFSAEEITAMDTTCAAYGKMDIAGKTGVIVIEGVLTEDRDYYASWFGGGNTTYRNIQLSIAEANADPNVEDIEVKLNSGGGDVNGLIATMDAIRDSVKPVRVVVRNMAASAAYGLASQADEIVVSSRATQLGSIGVAYDTLVFDGDIKEVSIASTDAAKKRPDLLTDKGKSVIREQLDDIHSIFVESIAKGRNTTAKKVNKNYGQGGILLAADALEAGMIDGIEDSTNGAKDTAAQASTPDPGSNKSAEQHGAEQEDLNMDLATLQTEHPGVFAEAVQVGVTQERERVIGHLDMGETCKAQEIAAKAVKEGAEFTPQITAQYISAMQNHKETKDRLDDNQNTGSAPAGSSEKTVEDVVAEKVCAALGAFVDEDEEV